MVSRSSRKKIAFGLIFIVVVGALIFVVSSRHEPVAKNIIYSATDDALDLAVLNGIVSTDKSSSEKTEGVVRAVVVPHHLVASESIARGIQALASSKPRVIIVISPDHYARCPKMLCTTTGSYSSFFGTTSIAEKEVARLEKSTIVADSELFTAEHGVYTIVPFIKHYIPDAQIIPIAVSQKGRGSEEVRAEILRLLKPLVSRKDVGLVISSDFSHYLPLAESNEMDIKTQNSFCSGNSQEILTLDNPRQSDCPLCLWILEQEAQELGFWNPHIIAHTNSADLLHDTSVKETTSHFAFVLSTLSTPGSCPLIEQKNEEQVSSEIKMLIIGDMMFDRYIRQVNEAHGSDFLFSCIDPLLKSADVVVGNLEGPITEHLSVSKGSVMGSPENYRFTFPTTTAAMLLQHDVNVVNIGNNHINDFGPGGISSTHKYLSDAGVSYFGGLAPDAPIYRMTEQGIDISFINYNQFGGDSVENVAALIASEHAQGRKVIVYTHWGEEYVDVRDTIRALAALFTENGADLIVGSHPHIVQTHEMIGDTPVYYSLGNFIFDQYFEPNVTKGLALLVHISKDKITVEEKPVSLNRDGRTCAL